MPTLPELLSQIEKSLTLGEGLVPTDEIESLRGSVTNIKQRLGYGEGFVLVALLGATGSGKSSLLNAIAGQTVTPAGHVRPTTSEPLAWIPASPHSGLVRLLDELGVHLRTGHDQQQHLAILDMPDVDSMVKSHRAAVEVLLPRVDVVIWVLDPEKYNDRVLHNDYLAPLADYSDQFLFVLNQTDKLEPAQRQHLMEDLRDRLVADGVADPKMLAIAADPDFGAPIGIDSLVAELEAEFSSKQIVQDKLRTDAGQIVVALCVHAHLDASPVASEWDVARDEAVGVLEELVAGGDYEEILEGAGRVKASIKTAGPIGLVLGAMKRNPLTRALGVRVAEELISDASARWASRVGIERAIAPVSAVFASSRGSSLLDHRIRGLGNDVEDAIRASVDGARTDVGRAAQLRVPGWWSLMAVLKWLGFAAVVAGAVWAFADPFAIERGGWPVPLLMILGGLGVGLLAWVTGRSGGARAGRKSVARFRKELRTALAVQMDRRIGKSILALEKERREFVESVAQLEAAAQI